MAFNLVLFTWIVTKIQTFSFLGPSSYAVVSEISLEVIPKTLFSLVVDLIVAVQIKSPSVVKLVTYSNGTPLIWVRARIREIHSESNDCYNRGPVSFGPVPSGT